MRSFHVQIKAANRSYYDLSIEELGVAENDRLGDVDWRWTLRTAGECQALSVALAGVHRGQYDLIPTVHDIVAGISNEMHSEIVGILSEAFHKRGWAGGAPAKPSAGVRQLLSDLAGSWEPAESTELSALTAALEEARGVARKMAESPIVPDEDGWHTCHFCGSDWEDGDGQHAPSCPVLIVQSWPKEAGLDRDKARKDADSAVFECLRRVMRHLAVTAAAPTVSFVLERDLARGVYFLPIRLLADYGIQAPDNFFDEAVELSKDADAWRRRLAEMARYWPKEETPCEPN